MANNLDNSTIMQTAAEGKADQLRDELRGRALSSLYYFSKVVMNFRELSPTFHLPKCLEIQNTILDQRRGFLWPRAHFKSTIITKCYVLWRLVGGGCTDIDYTDIKKDPRNKRWLLIGEADERVTSAVHNIKWHIENNVMLKWLFPEIIPLDINKTTWRDDAILLPRSASFDEPSIRAVGIGTKITGYHGDGFIFDDVIGEKAAKSEADMKAAKDWIDYSPGLVNDPSTVEVLYAGTRWKHGNADVYGALMEELPFYRSEDGMPHGIEWFVYSAVLEDGTPSFPERFTIETLEDTRRQQKDYKFSCQYLNTPSTPAGADFPADLVKSYKIETSSDGKMNRIVPNDGTPPLSLGQLIRISFFDPSSGGKSADCENSIIGLGTASDGRQFVLKCFLKNCGYRAAIEAWHLMNDQFVFYKCGYEAVGSQKTIEEFITERRIYKKCNMCDKQHRKLIPIGIRPPGGQMNKDERIRHFAQATIEEGKVYLGEGMFALRQQIINFPHFKLKDGLDALAYAIHMSTRPPDEEEVQEAREEHDAAFVDKASRVNTDQQYGGYV